MAEETKRYKVTTDGCTVEQFDAATYSPERDEFVFKDTAGEIVRRCPASGTIVTRVDTDKPLPADWKQRIGQTRERLDKKPNEPMTLYRDLFEALVTEDRQIVSWTDFEAAISECDRSWSFWVQRCASWHLLSS